MRKKKIFCVMGTRPEAIKMAPIISVLRQTKEWDVQVVSTSQHREMLDQMLHVFGITPDIDLDIMESNQTLPQLTAKLPLPLDQALKQEKPDFVLAQGDTTTAFMVSLACFYQQIPFGHVEAGLRTGRFYDPFPEEMNRVLISRLATLNFAPTEQAKQNLLNEGDSEQQIFVTGNTVIDALHDILRRDIKQDPRIHPEKRLLLVTAHRRENFGERLVQICRAVRTLVDRNEDIQVLYPVHPNPNVSLVAYQELGNHPRIILSEPLPYEQFVKTMQHAYVILSDSGGVQEEAPALGTPVLVARDDTERPEAINVGACKLVGADCDRIVDVAQQLLDSKESYENMIVGKSPYGDGKAAKRIGEILKSYLSIQSEVARMGCEKPDASIIVLTYNTKELILHCLQSLVRETEGVSQEIIIVDNGSSDDSAKTISSKFGNINLIRTPVNLGFGGGCNLGIQEAQGRYIVLLNSDAFLHPGTLEKAIEHMDADSSIGLGGARLIGKDGSWQPSARTFPSLLNLFLSFSGLSTMFPQSRFFGRVNRTWADPMVSADVDWVTGAFSIIRKDVLDDVGGFDERFFLYYEEIDLCKRIKKAGYSIRYFSDVVVTHLDGETICNIPSKLDSEKGRQSVKDNLESTFLYFYKHKRTLGALLAYLFLLSWMRLRYLKNRWISSSRAEKKREECAQWIQMIQKAWSDTKGGRKPHSRAKTMNKETEKHERS